MLKVINCEKFSVVNKEFLKQKTWLVLDPATDTCIVYSELRTILFFHVETASSYCANGWTETNFKKCLKFVSAPIKSWDDAQAACRSLGANLLTLNTPDEVEYIKTMRTLLPGERQHLLLNLLGYYHQ